MKHKLKKVLKWTAVTVAVFAVLSIGVVAAYSTSHKGLASTSVSDARNPDKIFDLVNEEREKRELSSLLRDARLDASAQFKASDMKAREYFAHTDPDTGSKNGLDVIERLVNGDCLRIGENILMDVGGEDGPEGIVKSWMNSESHREAILSDEYTHAGLAVSGVYVVQHFCLARQ